MATMWQVLKAVQPELEDRDLLSKREWNAICALKVTTSRRQASHFWEIMNTMKIFIPINGTTWRINKDALMSALASANPGNGVEA